MVLIAKAYQSPVPFTRLKKQIQKVHLNANINARPRKNYIPFTVVVLVMNVFSQQLPADTLSYTSINKNQY